MAKETDKKPNMIETLITQVLVWLGVYLDSITSKGAGKEKTPIIWNVNGKNVSVKALIDAAIASPDEKSKANSAMTYKQLLVSYAQETVSSATARQCYFASLLIALGETPKAHNWLIWGDYTYNDVTAMVADIKSAVKGQRGRKSASVAVDEV